MQPFYIKAMWCFSVVILVASDTFGMFTSKLHREQMHFFMFVYFVLACCVTMIHNKLKFGVYFPGAKMNANRLPKK